MTTATRATTTTCLVLALLGVGNLLLAVSRHVGQVIGRVLALLDVPSSSAATTMVTRTTKSLVLGDPVRAVNGPVPTATTINLVANLDPAVCDDLVQAVFGNLLQLYDLV